MTTSGSDGTDWDAVRESLSRMAEEVRRQISAALPALIDTTHLQEQMMALARFAEVSVYTARLREQMVALGRSLEASIDTRALKDFGERVRKFLPPNWSRVSDWDALAEIARIDGIPVAWVPRADILDEILQAENADARLRVLTAREADVLDDCSAVLASISNADLLEPARLAEQAVASYRDGHPSASQALAVVVCEAVITDHVANGRRYSTVAKDLEDADLDEVSLHEMRTAFALLPIPRFYTPWKKTDGTPPPPSLSRHVTVHFPSELHLTRANGLIALLLLSSLLRDLQEILET